MSSNLKFKITRIDQQNEFGKCYELTQVTENDTDTGELSSSAIDEDIKKKETDPKHEALIISKLFFKIPRRSHKGDMDSEEQELNNELKSKDSIKLASDRLKEVKGEEKYIFHIKKLIGRAILSKGGVEMKGLLYEFSEGKSISSDAFLDLKNKIQDSTSFLAFAKSFAIAIQKLHNQSVVHSYLVPRNIRYREEGNSLEFDIVGFGYAKLASSAGRKKIGNGEDFHFPEDDRLFLAPECKAANSFGDFWFPADIYSIGAIFYAVLCNMLIPKAIKKAIKKATEEATEEATQERINEATKKATLEATTTVKEMLNNVLENPPRDVLRLKKKIRQNLEEAAKDIIQGNENIVKIIDHCLRYRQEDRFSCIEELLESIDIALDAEGGSGKVPLNDSDKGHFPKEKLYFENLIKTFLPKDITLSNTILSAECTEKGSQSDFSKNPFLIHMVDEMVEDLMQDARKMRLGHLEVYGNRHEIVTSLCRMLCAAQPDSEYNTTTIPHYWLDSNLGSIGRFLTMNKHKARKGVRIR